MADHVESTGHDFTTGRWLAACSCGWEAREQRDTIEAAQEDWENHTDAVFMEATGG